MSEGPIVHFELLHTASCALACASRTFHRTHLSAIPGDRDSEVDVELVDLKDDEFHGDSEVCNNLRREPLATQSPRPGVSPWVVDLALIG